LNHEPAAPESVHRALLAGLLSHVGKREEKRDYEGTRNRKFSLFPGSHLAKKPPSWVMATELVDTGRVYARINGAIEPEWVIAEAGPLLQHSYHEPHFSRRHQAVMAKQKTTLYGLVLAENKLVSFGRIDPELARGLYIRGALVEGRYRGRAGFWQHNQALLREIAELETRLRRHDLMADDEDLYNFYDALLPAHICNSAALDKWRKRIERQTPRLLYLSRDLVLRRDPDTDLQQQFPDSMQVAGVELPLHYTFAPGKDADGVTAVVPLAALNRLPAARFEWLVPGLLREKCIELVKGLPRQWRKQLVPVPDTIDALLPRLQPGEAPLVECLAGAIHRQFGIKVAADAWSAVRLDPYYRMNFSVVDTRGGVIASGRDLVQLAERLRPQLQEEIVRAEPGLSGTYQAWEFGELPPSRVLQHGTQSVLVYPALVDNGGSVVLEHCDRAAEASEKTRLGLARLYMLALARQVKYLKKEFLRDNQVRLQLGQLMPQEQLLDDYLLAVFRNCFVDGRDYPRDAARFGAILRSHQGALLTLANDYHQLLMEIISLNHAIRIALGQLEKNAWQYAIADIHQQLRALLGEHFLLRVPDLQLREYPRFLRALVYRIEKLEGHRQKDQRGTLAIAPHIERLQRLAGDAFENLDAANGPHDYRWMLEEYRVSLFAQGVGTRIPVSAKRLDRAWQQWQEGRMALKPA
jgi:ATP-dependent helicase HrpA